MSISQLGTQLRPETTPSEPAGRSSSNVINVGSKSTPKSPGTKQSKAYGSGHGLESAGSYHGPDEIFTPPPLPLGDQIGRQLAGPSDPDVQKYLQDFRPSIIRIAKAYGIPRELLAGALAVEVFGGGVRGMNDADREASIYKFSLTGKSTLGTLGITKTDANIPTTHGSSWQRMQDRYAWAKKYDDNIDQQLTDAAIMLKTLGSRPNRYPTHLNTLSPHEMSILLTEYNKGATTSSAAAARPSETYGKRFLHLYSTIMHNMY